MLRLLGTLWTQRQLVRGFVVRDLKSRYVGSTMGFFWSVIVPFLYLFVFMFVFSLVLKQRWTDQATPKDTALYMLVGILAWQSFAETLSRATNCLVDNANLIQKVVFPSEILPAFLALSSLVNMLIGLPIVVVGVFLFLDQAPTPAYLALPVLIALQAIFTMGLGYALSTLNLFVRDTYHLIGVLTLVWMFGTPIFYPALMVEKAQVPLPGTARQVERWTKVEGPRVRVPVSSEVRFRLGPAEDLDPRWTVEPDEELPETELQFFAPVPADEAERNALRDAAEPPEEVEAYAILGSITYARQMVEERDTMSLGIFLELNPMYWLIDSYRRVVLLGLWPDPRHLAQLAVLSCLVFYFGARFFAKHQHRFPDLL
jgi:ABC-type polysaccharide/polyol phosphate export permease